VRLRIGFADAVGVAQILHRELNDLVNVVRFEQPARIDIQCPRARHAIGHQFELTAEHLIDACRHLAGINPVDADGGLNMMRPFVRDHERRGKAGVLIFQRGQQRSIEIDRGVARTVEGPEPGRSGAARGLRGIALVDDDDLRALVGIGRVRERVAIKRVEIVDRVGQQIALGQRRSIAAIFLDRSVDEGLAAAEEPAPVAVDADQIPGGRQVENGFRRDLDGACFVRLGQRLARLRVRGGRRAS
jgi:hypothetical protein